MTNNHTFFAEYNFEGNPYNGEELSTNLGTLNMINKFAVHSLFDFGTLCRITIIPRLNDENRTTTYIIWIKKCFAKIGYYFGIDNCLGINVDKSAILHYNNDGVKRYPIFDKRDNRYSINGVILPIVATDDLMQVSAFGIEATPEQKLLGDGETNIATLVDNKITLKGSKYDYTIGNSAIVPIYTIPAGERAYTFSYTDRTRLPLITLIIASGASTGIKVFDDNYKVQYGNGVITVNLNIAQSVDIAIYLS